MQIRSIKNGHQMAKDDHLTNLIMIWWSKSEKVALPGYVLDQDKHKSF